MEQFQELMSSGLTAYQGGNFESAREKLTKARAFEPESREVKDALSKVDQAIDLKKIEALKGKALLAEKTEHWEQALILYRNVLKIDGAVQFALRGKERCLEQMRAAEGIRLYLEKPYLLESDRHLEKALRLSRDASRLEPRGPVLIALIEKLDQKIITAQTPVKIILLSDNETEVAIFKVGKLGRFISQELELRPGTYTVMGTRRGYKDVQHRMVVEPGMDPLSLRVTCREKVI
jgi:tetratricopeptide (TPR) repeat protein